MYRPSIVLRSAIVVLLSVTHALAGDESTVPSPGATGSNSPVGISRLLARADAGDAIAQNLVGVSYLHGAGVARDYATAAKWFLRSAKAENRDGQANLG